MTRQRTNTEEKVFPIHHEGFPGFDAVHLACHGNAPYLILSIKNTPANLVYLNNHCDGLNALTTRHITDEDICFKANGAHAMHAVIEAFLAQGLYGLDQNHNLLSLLKMVLAQLGQRIAAPAPATLTLPQRKGVTAELHVDAFVHQRKCTQYIGAFFNPALSEPTLSSAHQASKLSNTP